MTEDGLSNPAPLGLMGFGMTTVLLNLHNAGLFELDTMILAMGICYGGLAQIVAGIMEYKKGNTFGTTAFLSYGLFWLSLVFMLVFDYANVWGTSPTSESQGYYLLMWGLFTGFMFIGTLKGNRALQFVFLSLTILFILLAIGDWTGNSTVTKIAGIEGIICGSSAIYTAMGEVINEQYGKVVFPLGVPQVKEENVEEAISKKKSKEESVDSEKKSE